MNLYLSSILIIIASNVVYQLAQKNINSNINPFFSLIITYGVGMLIAAIAWIFSDKDRNISQQMSNINIFTILLGISIVGLETGFLLAYRANWSMSVLVILSNTVVTVLLIFIGIIFFKESISLRTILGIILCATGLGLLTLKS